MGWIILLTIAVIVMIRFFADYHNKKVDTVASGGMRSKFHIYVRYFTEAQFIIAKETGSVIEFKKIVFSEPLGYNCELYIHLESVFTNILSAYVITNAGRKISSCGIEFKGQDNIENPKNIEQITRRVIASLESKGAL